MNFGTGWDLYAHVWGVTESFAKIDKRKWKRTIEQRQPGCCCKVSTWAGREVRRYEHLTWVLNHGIVLKLICAILGF